MKTEAWVHFFSEFDEETRSGITQSLKDAGISLRPLDFERPGGAGIVFFDTMSRELCDCLREIHRRGSGQTLAVALCELPSADAWKLLESGASDVLDRLSSPLWAQQVAARVERWNAVETIVASPLVRNNLVGVSRAWKSVLRQVAEVARFTESSILIVGESGTGKELMARLIHTLDPRAGKRDLVVLDCTTIVPELAGSEFFGHEKGAFTGATATREGAFALANGGTLFLDEVGELPVGLQCQLLRVIQERSFKKVGSNTWEQTHFRLVCATNRDLCRAVENGEFRHDLYYRIANWVCRLPPLRERSEDILPLARHFLKECFSDGRCPELDGAVCDYLLKRGYPGNVRELKQLVSRISHRHVGDGPVTVGDIPEDERPIGLDAAADWRGHRFEQVIRHALAAGVGLKELREAAVETAINIALDEEGGNLQRAARKLGVTDRALQMRRASNRNDPPKLASIAAPRRTSKDLHRSVNI